MNIAHCQKQLECHQNLGLLSAQVKCTANSFSFHPFTIASVSPCSFLSLLVFFVVAVVFSASLSSTVFIICNEI